ncbi:MAG: mannose-1-phosphate guanylyltransferase, partial [Thiobacillaceae bacterium]
EALETAGGIATALPLLNAEIFPVINGDIFCDYDFSKLPQAIEVIRRTCLLGYLVLVDNPPHHPQGDFVLNEGRVSDKGSLPTLHSSPLTFSGIGVYHRDMFARAEAGKKAPLAPLLRAAMALGKVGGEHYTGRWVDVGTPERLRELDRIVTGQMC